jgi:hypothetical protein
VIVLAVSLLIAVMSSPHSREQTPWPWFAWALAITAVVTGIVMLERGAPW